MFERVFNGDNIFFRIMGRIGDFMCLNFLYLVSCIPIITIGAASCALYQVLYDMSEGKEQRLILSYIRGFRRFLVKGMIYECGILLSGAMILLGFKGIGLMNGGLQVVMQVFYVLLTVLFCGLLFFGITSIAWHDTSVKTAAKNAVLMTVGSLPWLIVLILITALPWISIPLLSVKIVAYIVPLMLLFGITLVAYGKTYIYKKVYKKYLG